MEYILEKNNSKYIKLICALLIVFGHSISYSNCKYLNAINIGYAWVGIFFFYTAYIMKGGYKYNIKKIYINIWLPFSLLNVIYYICFIGSDISVQGLFLGLTGLKLYCGILWYVYELIGLYIIYFLLSKLKIENNTWIQLLVYLMFLIICVILDVGTNWYISSFCILMGLNYDKIKYKNIYGIYTLLLYLCIATFQVEILNNNKVLTLLHMMFTPLFTITFLYYANLWISKINNLNILSILKEYSYEIYLTHPLVMLLLADLEINYIIYILLLYLVTLIFSHLLHIIIKYIKRFTLSKIG